MKNNRNFQNETLPVSAQYLETYLFSTEAIDKRYTQKYINVAIELIKDYGEKEARELIADCCDFIDEALGNAHLLVRDNEHITPTRKDWEEVAALYIDYVTTCALFRLGIYDLSNETAAPQILTTSNYWHTDHFTVVDKFPASAIVWNIGRHNFPFPEFIPVAFPLENYKIDRSRLMAVRCKDAETADAILKAAGRHRVDAEQFADLNE